jgi:hypothetical protein
LGCKGSTVKWISINKGVFSFIGELWVGSLRALLGQAQFSFGGKDHSFIYLIAMATTEKYSIDGRGIEPLFPV